MPTKLSHESALREKLDHMRRENEKKLRYFRQGDSPVQLFDSNSTDRPSLEPLGYSISLRDCQGIPELTSIRYTPYHTRSGELISWDGYYPESGIYLHVDPDLFVPVVSKHPKKDEVARAKDLILDKLLGDLPFRGEADLAGALCAILYPFAPEIVAAPAPLIILNHSPLLISLVSLLFNGEDVYPLVLADGRPGDLARDLEPLLRVGVPCAAIEALSGHVNDRLVRAFGRSYLGRVFGLSQFLTNRILWCAADVTIDKEVESEVLRVHLDPEPEESLAQDLADYVLANRGHLIWAVLTLIENWLSVGRPLFPSNVIVGHAEWTSRMGEYSWAQASRASYVTVKLWLREPANLSVPWRNFLQHRGQCIQPEWSLRPI